MDTETPTLEHPTVDLAELVRVKVANEAHIRELIRDVDGARLLQGVTVETRTEWRVEIRTYASEEWKRYTDVDGYDVDRMRRWIEANNEEAAAYAALPAALPEAPPVFRLASRAVVELTTEWKGEP